MTLENYINNLNQRFTLGNATEHTFRGDLQQLLETFLPEIRFYTFEKNCTKINTAISKNSQVHNCCLKSCSTIEKSC